MAELDNLKNTFFIIRHGEADNNVEHIVVSNPDIGTTQYGLTERGRGQALQAAERFKSEFLPPLVNDISKDVVIVSSDFLRTHQTAEILHSQLHPEAPIRYEIGLRERWYGDFDNTYISRESNEYRTFYDLDEKDPTHTYRNCESLVAVVLRTTRLVQQLDKEYSDKVIILVSHGDPCMCLYSISVGVPPEAARQFHYFTNCDIKQLTGSK
jgi:probable phosphoglycerate mutase